MTPQQDYNGKVKNGAIVGDDEQLTVIKQLDDIYHRLLVEHKRRKSFFAFLCKHKSVRGMYLCGGVGIGKTMMMDCFYQAIPFENKMRMHFHQFMRMVHKELKKYQGKKNPVSLIANDLAKKYMLICFDEFFVTDITDAMLLARLLEALFANGVTLVATSNVMPDDLYRRGLQRDQFLPAIDLIKHHCAVWHIPATNDYRMRHLSHAGVFFVPNDAEAAMEMQKSFDILAQGEKVSFEAISVCGRDIPVIKVSDSVVWFDFSVICLPPRSQHDYLEIAERYNTVFISNITSMSSQANDRISLFIKLIDVFYDTHTRLVISAEDTVDELYKHGRMIFEYTRVCSRLGEMQSDHYFYRS